MTSVVTKATAFILAIILIILAINNTIYYYSTKKLLTDALEEKMDTVAQQLRISIDQSEIGAEFVEGLMAENLRTASIAIQYALDHKADNITNEQLIELRDKLHITQITLFKETPDDIIGYRSTDPEEIGLSTNGWKYWYDAFKQLMAKQPVTVEKGQTMPNFWSGPFEISTANPANIEKWGYYYDGTTDYMIDPYISADKMNRYDNLVGPPAVVTKLLKANSFLKEITVFNHGIFGTTPKQSRNAKNETWIHFERRPILYGSYVYENKSMDVAYVRESMRTGHVRSYLDEINGVKVYKSFVPVASSDLPYVIGVTSDYTAIQDKLNKQFRGLIITVIAATLLGIAITGIILKLIRKRQDSVVQAAQETYIHEVNELFTSIRGQRHDFMNQVQTIYTMASLGKFAELKAFTSEMIGDIRVINDIIRIGNPALAALIQSKTVAAADKKIKFTYEVSDLNEVKLGVKSVDIVKIIGNLVDNAFDEVSCLSEDLREVKLVIQELNGSLHIAVRNPGRTLSDEELDRIFDAGYSTRNDGEHHGLGLAITKERVRYYKGTIQATSSPESGIVFEVEIPLAN